MTSGSVFADEHYHQTRLAFIPRSALALELDGVVLLAVPDGQVEEAAVVARQARRFLLDGVFGRE